MGHYFLDTQYYKLNGISKYEQLDSVVTSLVYNNKNCVVYTL